MTKKRQIAVCSLVILLFLSVLLTCAFAFNKTDGVFAASVFEYDGKVKATTGDVDDGKRGLRLYAYDNGATAKFKSVQTDVFQSEMQIASFDGNKGLKKYSLSFKDETSGKSFSVRVSAYSGYNDVAVVYNDVAGGIVYNESSGKTLGVTAGYNEQGVYTKFTSNVFALSFDPDSLQVKIKADDGNYRLVWDFKKQYNDGKLLANDLNSFKEYTVSVVFDEISANSRGDLLLCSFGGYSLAKENVEYRPSILIDSGARPVVNKEYDLPTAKATGENGSDVSDKIRVSVYDENGNLLRKDVKSYTPTAKGTLYLYYEYKDNGVTSDAWFKAEVLDETEITKKFVYEDGLIEKAGLNAKIYVPKATVITNAVVKGSENCLVTVRKDGKVVDGYDKKQGGFLFKATETGVYEIEYTGEKSYAYNKEVKKITIVDDLLVVNSDDVPDVIAAGTEYEFPSAELCFGSDAKVVPAKIITPEGEEKSGKIKFTESGKYTLVYSATLNGEDREYRKDFLVKQRFVDGFDTDAEFTAMRTNNETTGVKITLTDNKTVTYGKTIDLSTYTFDDKTNSGKTLLKASFDPKACGTNDLDAFYVVLTDKYDPTNYISIRMKYLTYAPLGTFIRARASEQASWVGYHYEFASANRLVHAAGSHEEGGFVSSGNFVRSLNSYEYDFMSLNLYFDYETKRLYSQPLWLTGHDDFPGDKVNGHPEYNSRKVPWLVYDFATTDAQLSAGNRPWKGFTTGEAILSVYAKGASGGADVFMMTIDGEDLTKPLYDDNKTPIISVDVDENAVPTAKVGEPYKLFDYTATDADSKIVDKGVTVVNDASGKLAEISADGTFTPVEGTYTAKYYAVDAFGHRAEKNIRITAKRNVDAPELNVFDTMPKEAKYGDTIILADYEILNVGSGKPKVDVKVKCGKEEIPVSNGAFECKGVVGTYVVTYTITDHIGESREFKKRITVTREEGIKVDENRINLPKAFMNNDKFIFDTYYGLYYDENLNEVSIPSVITVTDANGVTTIGKDGIYAPKTSESRDYATVTVSFDYNGLNKTVTRDVPVKDSKAGENYIAKYFVTENVSVSMSSGGLMFTSNEGADKMSFSFARPIYAKELSLRFIADASAFNAETFTVTLTDKQDGLKKVVLTYTKQGGTWACSVNGGTKTLTFPDVNGYMQIVYNDATRTFTDANDTVLGVAEKMTNGLDFNGFGGYAYLDCEVTGVKGTTRIGVRTINNQTINSVKRDMQNPYVKAEHVYAGRVPMNSEIELGNVIAYDVLSSVGEVKVSVRRGDETVVSEKTLVVGDKLKITECGKYKITFKVTDASGNTGRDEIDFSVYDPVKPELTFDKPIAEKVTVGKTLKLPNYTVNDNQKEEVSVHVYVLGPDGTKEWIKDGKYTFGQKGTYTIIYLATDPNDNVVMYRFVVKAE